MKVILLVFVGFASISDVFPEMVYEEYQVGGGGGGGYDEGGGGGGYNGGGGGGGHNGGGGATGYVYHKQGKHNYDFGYDVQDPYHGSHSRKEKKEDGYVTGTYSYKDKDGSTVVVDYEADPKNGFRATVKDKNGVKQYGYDSHDDGGNYDAGNGGNYDAGNGGNDDNGYGQMGGNDDNGYGQMGGNNDGYH